jgi:hypothetical protein
MKIIKSIENALTKAEAKRGTPTVATVRQDTVRKAIERGEFELIKCAYDMTDDYAWDAVNNFGWKKRVSKETMAREYSILTPSCWVDPKTHTVNDIECYEISISFHSNLAYDMYVPVDGKKSEPVKHKCSFCGNTSHAERKIVGGYTILEDCENCEKEIMGAFEMGEFESLNFILDHPEMDFVGYEFEGKEIYIEDSGCEQSLFRMDVDKETGTIVVSCAYSEDFDIMEDCTDQFDTEKLFADIKECMENSEDVDNQGEQYVRYCKFQDAGYESDEAITMCYDEEEALPVSGDEDEPVDYAMNQDRFDRGY